MENKRNPRYRKEKKECLDRVEQVLAYSNGNHDPLDKFNISFFIHFLDSTAIRHLSSMFSHSTEISIEQFVCAMLMLVKHNKEETIFLIMGLANFYKTIRKNTSHNQEIIRFSDFTNFLYEKISDIEPGLIIPERNSSQIQKSHQAPCIFYHASQFIPKISTDRLKKNKSLFSGSPLTQLHYSPKMKKILALGRLASCIEFYDEELNFIRAVYPIECKQMNKSFPILSFSFSQNHKCIGCLIKNLGLVFWDAYDNFESQKTIKKVNGDKILYFQLLNTWATIEQNSLNFWNLKQELITMSIKIKNTETINAVCQIHHLGVLMIAYTLRDQSKWFYMFKVEDSSWKIMSKMQVPNGSCHHLYYSKSTQVILVLGYRNNVPIYQVDHISADLYPIQQLNGHRSIVTSVIGIGGSIIVTGDDSGQARVWDLKYIRCLQVIRISKQILTLQYTSENLLFGDKRLNLVEIEKNPHYSCSSKDKIIRVLLDDELDNFYVFTKTSCHVFSMQNGIIKEIHVLCSEEQITIVHKHRNSFFLGTTKGNIIKYGFDFKKKTQSHIHEGEISKIYSDQEDIFITSSNDGCLKVWVHSPHFQISSKILTHLFIDEETTIIQMLKEYKLLVLSSGNRQLYICDYQSLKIIKILTFTSNVVTVKFLGASPILLISCQNGTINAYLFLRGTGHEILEKSDLKINSVSLEGGQYWQNILIYGERIVLLGSSKGRLVKINLYFLLELNYLKIIHWENQYLKESPTMHRPVRQSFKDLLPLEINSQKETDFPTSVINVEKVKENKINGKSLLQLEQYSLNNFILAHSSDNHIYIINQKTFQTLSIKNLDKIQPHRWIKIQKNKDQVMNSYDDTFKILKKIENCHLDPTSLFYTQKMKKKQIKQAEQTKKIIEKITESDIIQQSQKINCFKNSEYQTEQDSSKDFLKKQDSIKNLEIYKRVKSIKEQRKQENVMEMKIQKNLKDKLERQNNEERKALVSFFRPAFRKRFKPLMNSDEQNSLVYNRIEFFLKKKEITEKNMSLPSTDLTKKSSFNREGLKKQFLQKRKSTSSFVKPEILQKKQVSSFWVAKSLLKKKYSKNNSQSLKQMLKKEPKKFRYVWKTLDEQLRKARKV